MRKDEGEPMKPTTITLYFDHMAKGCGTRIAPSGDRQQGCWVAIVMRGHNVKYHRFVLAETKDDAIAALRTAVGALKGKRRNWSPTSANEIAWQCLVTLG